MTNDLVALGRVHIIGIGGAGMSGIARLLAAAGVTVSGSDARDSARIEALRALGIAAHVGHDARWIEPADTVIASTAIPASNVERVAALDRGLTVLTRAEALALLMRGFRTIAVAGTHGKTTTTSMVTVALQHCGADPSFAIGSELNESGSNAHRGTGDVFVVEADESDGAFLEYDPLVGIVTNVEADHLNHWGTFEAIEQAFVTFAEGIASRDGTLVACADDAGARRLAERARAAGVSVRTYGTSEDADVRMTAMSLHERGWSFDVDVAGTVIAHLSLQVPGQHNARNAVAALTAGMSLGFDAAQLAEGLNAFRGSRRRFDFKGEVDGIRVFDDYAHHPTEIDATLRAARDVVGSGRLIVAFQAHHYYRTAMFVEEFGQALGLADDVVVLEVFAPGETPIPGASGLSLAMAVPRPADQVVFEPSWSAVAGHLVDRARPGDLIMTLGAGDIGMIGLEVLGLLRARAHS